MNRESKQKTNYGENSNRLKFWEFRNIDFWIGVKKCRNGTFQIKIHRFELKNLYLNGKYRCKQRPLTIHLTSVCFNDLIFDASMHQQIQRSYGLSHALQYGLPPCYNRPDGGTIVTSGGGPGFSTVTFSIFKVKNWYFFPIKYWNT